jgi:drug/metabolite transporter (DMT)-like permease
MGRARGFDATGLALLLATLLGWSSVLLFLKHLTGVIDSWTANGWRYGISALLWLPLLLYKTGRGTLPPGIWRRALPPAAFNIAGQICFGMAPYYIDPGLAAFLLRVSIVSSLAGAFTLFADERALLRSGLFWCGLVLVAVGASGTILFRVSPIGGATAAGIGLALGAGISYGLYGVSVRYWMRGIDSMTSFAAIALYTAIGMVSLMLWKGQSRGMDVLGLRAFDWVMLIASALVGIAIAHVFYYSAINRLGVAVANAILQAAPFLTAVGSMLVFGEILTGRQWVSGAVLLAGAIILLRAEQSRPRTPAGKGFPVVADDAGDPTVIAEGVRESSPARDLRDGDTAADHGNKPPVASVASRRSID